LSHFHDINNYLKIITDACTYAAEATIPYTCSRGHCGRIPGWKERVQSLRVKSRFWHKIWLECHRPGHGAAADEMRRTCAAYRYSIRRAKKDEDDALLDNGGRNFWSEIKRIRGNKVKAGNTVDGFNDVNDTARLFTAKYRELYTSVPYDVPVMLTLIEDINRSLSNTAISTDRIFHANDIKTAVSRLKSGKRDGNNKFSSDHIINAGDDCLTHIAFLFSAITIHGTVADNLLISTIVPIPKGHKVKSSDSANFCGIVTSSVYGKIFDHIIKERYQEKLTSCELQFGFKAKSSTNLCSMVLKDTIAYYTHYDSAVFCTIVDATKAFDTLQYYKLFKLFIKRQLPAHIIRVLINIYTHNLVCFPGVVSHLIFLLL
jgi:hypothetical protein